MSKSNTKTKTKSGSTSPSASAPGGLGFPAGIFAISDGTSYNLVLTPATTATDSGTLSLAAPSTTSAYQQWSFDGCLLYGYGGQYLASDGDSFFTLPYALEWQFASGKISSVPGNVCLGLSSSTLNSTCSDDTGWTVPTVNSSGSGVAGSGFPAGTFTITNGSFSLVITPASVSGTNNVVSLATTDSSSEYQQWYYSGCFVTSMYDNQIFGSDGTNFFAIDYTIFWGYSSTNIKSETDDSFCLGYSSGSVTNTCSDWTLTPAS